MRRCIFKSASRGSRLQKGEVVVVDVCVCVCGVGRGGVGKEYGWGAGGVEGGRGEERLE